MFLPRLLAALLTAFGTANAQCDLFWQYFEPTNSCFRLFNIGGNFFQTDEFCHTQGAHLPILTTIEETQYVENLMIDFLSNKPIEESSFVGLTASDGKCNWEWLDGTPLNSSVVQFTSNQGRSCFHGEYCSFVMHPNYQLHNNKILGDHTCNWRVKRTLCKKTAKPKTPVVPPVCDNGWTFYNETKSCFKIFSRSANWDQAKAHCASFDGYLAKITTLGETKLVKEMVKHYPVRDMPLIGLSAPNGDCDFRWVDGTPLDTTAVAFTKLHNNPNLCRTVQRCGKVYGVEFWTEPKYILDDIGCGDIHMRLLCKKAAVLPVEEKVECKSGWTRLTGTNTCVKESKPRETSYQQVEGLKSKCTSMPLRSHFDSSTETCFVRSNNCYSVSFPAPQLRNPNYGNIRRTLERKQVLTGNSRLCAYGPNKFCESGKTNKNQHCFWLTEKAGSWSAASNDCQKEGGTLYVPHNDRHMQSALEFLTEQKPKSDVVWLGLVSTDSWKSLDGSEVDYLRWRPVVNGSDQSSAVTEASLLLYQTVSKQDGAFAGYMRAKSVKDSFHGLCSSMANDAYFPLERN